MKKAETSQKETDQVALVGDTGSGNMKGCRDGSKQYFTDHVERKYLSTDNTNIGKERGNSYQKTEEIS